MDHTFEEGVMCGMLLSNNKNNGGSGIKEDKIFQYIVNNGIPYATVKITDTYKCVYVLVDGNEILQCEYASMTYIICHQFLPYVIYSKDPNRPHASISTYPHRKVGTTQSSGVLVINAMIFYKNDIPLWSKYLGTYKKSDSAAVIPIYYDDFHHVGAPNGVELTNYKELVGIHTSKNIWLKDTIKYVGDYFLNIIDIGSLPLLSNGKYRKIADDNGNPVSDLQTGYDIEEHNYSYSYYQMKHPVTGKQTNDLSKRPKVEETSVNTISISISLDSTVPFLAHINGNIRIHTDLDEKSLLDLDKAVIADVYKTHYKTVVEGMVNPTWLN